MKIFIARIAALTFIATACTNHSSKNKESENRSTDTAVAASVTNDSLAKVTDTQHLAFRNYELILRQAIKKIDSNNITRKDIATVIPATDEEFSKWYELTYDDKGTKYFYRLDDLFYKYALKNDEVLRQYLNLAEFVDGEYAESYFDDISFLVKKRRRQFCSTYKELSSRARERLHDYQLQCK
jgi:hypothetical protein